MAEDYFKVRLSDSVRVALPLDRVETVLQLDRHLICPIPGISSGLLGVVNRRGTLTWVLDLSHFLELGAIPLKSGQNLTAIVLTKHGQNESQSQPSARQSVACVVEELEGVFAPPKIKPMTKRLKSRLRPLFAKVAYHGKSGIAILDPTALLQTLYTEATPT